MMSHIDEIAKALLDRKATLATAESCTGGLLGHLLTNVAGSSAWYVGGVVSYSNAVKHSLLGVRRDTLAQEGAVSEAVAEQMARGCRQAFDTDFAISVTGIAGPGGGSEEKPVGLVFVAVATPERVEVRRFGWQGSREANKQSSADAAFALLAELLREPTQDALPARPQASVDATFGADGSIRPLAFLWNGRSQRITDWSRQWEEGGTRHFLVMTAGDRVWELCFSPATLGWAITPKSAARHMA